MTRHPITIREDAAGSVDWLASSAATRRGRVLLVASTVAVTLFAGAVVWLFGSAPPERERPANVASLPSVDGTLLVVEGDRLVLDSFQPLDGDREIEFVIRERDRSHFDLAHLRSHSSIALPTRLFYEEEGGIYYAVYKEDAPANSAAKDGQ